MKNIVLSGAIALFLSTQTFAQTQAIGTPNAPITPPSVVDQTNEAVSKKPQKSKKNKKKEKASKKSAKSSDTAKKHSKKKTKKKKGSAPQDAAVS